MKYSFFNLSKRLLALSLCALIALLAVSCTPAVTTGDDTGKGITGEGDNSDVENIGDFVFTADNYPKMGGSLAALPLGEAVTATVLGIDRKAANGHIVFEGSTTDNYKAIVDGKFDILLAYEPSEEAKEYVAAHGKELEMTPIGIDALVFICSLENKVNSLTTQQIKDIYTGKITNWSEVGGEDLPIIPYQRNKDSGSQTLFDKIINLGDDLMDAPKEQIVGSMIGLLEAVAEYDNSEGALGYTVYYYLTNMESDKLGTSKILAVDGVVPNNDTIGTGEYPFGNEFYVVIDKTLPEDSPARILYNWICSEQGRELVKQEKYVPYNK